MVTGLVVRVDVDIDATHTGRDPCRGADVDVAFRSREAARHDELGDARWMATTFDVDVDRARDGFVAGYRVEVVGVAAVSNVLDLEQARPRRVADAHRERALIGIGDDGDVVRRDLVPLVDLVGRRLARRQTDASPPEGRDVPDDDLD